MLGFGAKVLVYLLSAAILVGVFVFTMWVVSIILERIY